MEDLSVVPPMERLSVHEELAAFLKKQSDLRELGLQLSETDLCPRCQLLLPTEHCLDTLNGIDQAFPGQLVAQSSPFCQCEKLAQVRRKALLDRANLPHFLTDARTFANFDRSIEGTDDCFAAAKQFADGEGPHMLVMLGETPGNGKTHLLEAIGRERIERGQTVRYEHVPELLDRLRSSFWEDAPEPTWQILDRCNQVRVLLLDDMGLEKESDWTIEKLTTLLNYRYRSGWWLAVASNLSYEKFLADRRNFRLADRLFDTGSGDVRVAYNTAPSFRTGQR